MRIKNSEMDEAFRIADEVRMAVECKTAKECWELARNGEIQRVKHGRWEKLDLWTKPVCSVCGEPCFGLHGFSYETAAYCPNCGADMRGEENDSM